MRSVAILRTVAVGVVLGCGAQSSDPPGGPMPAGGNSGSGSTGGGPAGAGGTAGTEGGVANTASLGVGGARAVDAGSTSDGGGTPTFTQIYSQILAVSCAGASCHNPGMQHGISFATQSSAYSAVMSLVIPGDGEGSSFFYTVNSGTMPPQGPKLSATNLEMIKAWIDAGAHDN